jgi:hypothetical protein
MDYGYTYTTISGRPGEAMRVGTSFYLDEDTHIQVTGAGGDRVFLSIDHGEVGVTIGPRVNVRLTDQDVSFVRRLAQESARLLAEVERIHAEQAERAATAA